MEDGGMAIIAKRFDVALNVDPMCLIEYLN